jgi:hypothetical protein
MIGDERHSSIFHPPPFKKEIDINKYPPFQMGVWVLERKIVV